MSKSRGGGKSSSARRTGSERPKSTGKGRTGRPTGEPRPSTCSDSCGCGDSKSSSSTTYPKGKF